MWRKPGAKNCCGFHGTAMGPFPNSRQESEPRTDTSGCCSSGMRGKKKQEKKSLKYLFQQLGEHLHPRGPPRTPRQSLSGVYLSPSTASHGAGARSSLYLALEWREREILQTPDSAPCAQKSLSVSMRNAGGPMPRLGSQGTGTKKPSPARCRAGFTPSPPPPGMRSGSGPGF